MKIARAALLAAGVVALMGAPRAVAALDPFEINAILPVTGTGAFLGRAEVETLTLLADLVNRSGGVRGRQIKFVIGDDQSNPQVGLQLANALIAKKVSLIIGPALSAVCSAVIPLVKDGPVLYCLTPGVHPPEGSFVFSASISTADLLAATARYFHDRGWRKVAAITSTDASGQDGERGIVAAFNAAAGEEIVLNEHFNTSDLSVAAQMARIKNSEAQAIVSWGTGTRPGPCCAARQAGLDSRSRQREPRSQMRAYAAFPQGACSPCRPRCAEPAAALRRRTIGSFLSRSSAGSVRISGLTPWIPAARHRGVSRLG